MYIFCFLSWSSLSLVEGSYFNKKLRKDFLLLSSYIASLRHNNLLHTTAPGYKGSRFCSLSSAVFLYHTTLILICYVLSSFRSYYIQFKELKILWGLVPGAEGSRPDMRAGGRITQTPTFIQLAKSYTFLLRFS